MQLEFLILIIALLINLALGQDRGVTKSADEKRNLAAADRIQDDDISIQLLRPKTASEQYSEELMKELLPEMKNMGVISSGSSNQTDLSDENGMITLELMISNHADDFYVKIYNDNSELLCQREIKYAEYELNNRSIQCNFPPDLLYEGDNYFFIDIQSLQTNETVFQTVSHFFYTDPESINEDMAPLPMKTKEEMLAYQPVDIHSLSFQEHMEHFWNNKGDQLTISSAILLAGIAFQQLYELQRDEQLIFPTNHPFYPYLPVILQDSSSNNNYNLKMDTFSSISSNSYNDVIVPSDNINNNAFLTSPAPMPSIEYTTSGNGDTSATTTSIPPISSTSSSTSGSFLLPRKEEETVVSMSGNVPQFSQTALFSTSNLHNTSTIATTATKDKQADDDDDEMKQLSTSSDSSDDGDDDEDDDKKKKKPSLDKKKKGMTGWFGPYRLNSVLPKVSFQGLTSLLTLPKVTFRTRPSSSATASVMPSNNPPAIIGSSSITSQTTSTSISRSTKPSSIQRVSMKGIGAGWWWKGLIGASVLFLTLQQQQPYQTQDLMAQGLQSMQQGIQGIRSRVMTTSKEMIGKQILVSFQPQKQQQKQSVLQQKISAIAVPNKQKTITTMKPERLTMPTKVASSTTATAIAPVVLMPSPSTPSSSALAMGSSPLQQLTNHLQTRYPKLFPPKLIPKHIPPEVVSSSSSNEDVTGVVRATSQSLTKGRGQGGRQQAFSKLNWRTIALLVFQSLFVVAKVISHQDNATQVLQHTGIFENTYLSL